MSEEMIKYLKRVFPALYKPLPEDVKTRLFVKFNENVKVELARALDHKR